MRMTSLAIRNSVLCRTLMITRMASSKNSPGTKPDVSESSDMTHALIPGKYDAVGPIHPVSNLRPVKFARKLNESSLAVRLRHLKLDTQEFNQAFWINHNTDFAEGRQRFIKNLLETKYKDSPDKKTLSAEEMSIFYRDFLNENWKNHVNYNLEWQKRNWKIVAMSGLVQLQNMFRGR